MVEKLVADPVAAIDDSVLVQVDRDSINEMGLGVEWRAGGTNGRKRVLRTESVKAKS